ncbi:MAG TPA: ATP-binding protein [Candidatus Hydrogenedens sp.]|nr:ATP-binding protein [Candidatus Hydrogenedens sp.]HOL20168.1 ATP-binding protein [Candidatus Hydrogenedens sp.]
MDKNIIKQVVIDQRGELEHLYKRNKIVERSILNLYRKQIDSDLIKVIMGIRRCGKSIFAYQLFKDRHFAYLNFDDERLSSLDTSDLNTILEIFYEVYGEFREIIFDEIQNIPKWELFVNRLHRQNFNIIVTGSNAKLLGRELATHLTGRHLRVELFPFSFKEYLAYYGFQEKKLLTTKETAFIKKKLNEYIQTGGFPETLKGTVDTKPYLQSLYSTLITKDVVLRHRVKFVNSLIEIANYLITNYSGLISFNKIKNIFKLKSIHTSLNYISYLEEAYLFFFVKRLAFKYKESVLANRKCYCIDTGLIHALSFKTSENLGKVYENIVALELQRKKYYENIEFYYWQDVYKNEVDFVIKEGIKIKQLIQVCHRLDNHETREREMKALIKCSKELKCNQLLIITEYEEGEEIIGKKRIQYIPLWKWLLEKSQG